MRLALQEAERGLGRTSPNPVVGAVVVKAGRVVGKGHHARAGGPHAEIAALKKAGKIAKGATLYTTLEPCDHYGRTPPCSEAILAAGVTRVVCGSADPNPLVNGRGIARLRRARVKVETGVLRAEADRLNRPFFKLVEKGMPWVTLKAAITLDGKLATDSGESKWISGEASREDVHRLRDRVDAVVVGAQTARRDDPLLTTRLPKGKGHNALRVVVDSGLTLPADRKLFDSGEAKTVVATTLAADDARALTLANRGVEVWTLPRSSEGVDLAALLRRLGEQGALHVLVEGGATLFASLLRAGLADELVLYVAPKILGAGKPWVAELGITEMERALRASAPQVERFGDDLKLSFLLGEGRSPRRSRKA
jgi:diaminohydroxyphosphoribosylaminopyrimidine deaminase/5-amino-6-(5-phosphoribosylamino)uracil reductase